MGWKGSCYVPTFQEVDRGRRRLTFQEIGTLDHFGLSNETLNESLTSVVEVSIPKSYIITFTHM